MIERAGVEDYLMSRCGCMETRRRVSEGFCSLFLDVNDIVS